MNKPLKAVLLISTLLATATQAGEPQVNTQPKATLPSTSLTQLNNKLEQQLDMQLHESIGRINQDVAKRIIEQQGN
ncbi:hypothetical protein [Pseudoalteromonas ruthenica]|uniref:Uncharacterized protein n=1 Tax=Pseudoalteromonas ruthenica TaxID=151081 RepID=A0A0F4PTQ0_9GAMM|nr:hypothetical protein [Pseudoalteromonas ruthenica]KJY97641.1 hypothetical protein TW76_07360 [Pseudoalteromonas ruthenica]KJZ01668.1 hypothetical protein TW72_01575 [Pseudoalteromonas ruthenica]TMO89042.1 hypothetical protein CWC12_05265 [Pseudoalteromonas ruthenica]TMO94937.1 hypothetical protein CWC13_01895 [Pseudoalteromonas ruthenica]TMO97038.1 hypothetical protein CWC07_15290 [Pseudoalteromonas ruthenica]